MSARIGRMRHRIRIEQPVSTPDGAGGSSVTWTEIATAWAALRPLSADEIVDGDGLAQRITHDVVLRFRPGVTAAMRFVSNGRVFALRSVMDPNETGIWLRCLVEELQT